MRRKNTGEGLRPLLCDNKFGTKEIYKLLRSLQTAASEVLLRLGLQTSEAVVYLAKVKLDTDKNRAAATITIETRTMHCQGASLFSGIHGTTLHCDYCMHRKHQINSKYRR